MGKGWISIHRSLEDHWIWTAERFSKGQAWIDLLLLANHKEKQLMINGKMTVIKRGQMWTSISKLSQKWGWDRATTKRYLNVLQSEGMIYHHTTTVGTLITVIKWDFFQGRGGGDATTESTTESTTDPATGTTTESTQTINKQCITMKINNRVVPTPLDYREEILE